MTESTPLNPLKMILAINRDTRLNPGERVALIGAVTHADNLTRKVGFSQKALAEELRISRDTVKSAFRKGMALRYFSHKRPWRNDRGHMMTDYYFMSHPPVVPLEATVTEPVVPEKSREPVVEPVVPEKSPSTPSTTTSNSEQAPCFEHEVPGCRCYLATTEQETAPEVEEVEGKPCGCPLWNICPECRPTPKVESKRPEHEQRQFHEQQNESEGLNALGYGEESEKRVSGYRSRSQS